MRTVRRAVAAGVAVVLAIAGAWAQERPGSGARQGGPGWGFGAEGAMAEAVAAVATNQVVARAIGLTGEQQASLKGNLQAEKMRAALAAFRLAEALSAVLTDPEIVADLGLTEAQVNAVKQAMTPALIKQALAPQEMERLARALTAGTLGRGAIQAVQERMKEFDKDGDGRLSDEERKGAMDAWRQRGGQRGGRWGGRAPRL